MQASGEAGASADAAADDMVRLGVIARPHGVRGEVRVHPYNQESELLNEVRTVHLVNEDGSSRRARLKRVRRAPKVWLAKFEGVNSIEEAEPLRGVYVALPRDRLPALDEGEFYLRDTVGMAVVRDGERLGEVIEVMLYPSIECLRVAFDDGVREVPAMRPWLKRVDTEAREVRVGDLSDLPVES